ncbi:MAG: glycosyltransferase family 4 protein [Planctomycetia bacterium]|nr:glycosyltransferase family 4 protein [Planctomycetia bacterium]
MPRSPRLLYAAGPGNVAGTYQHWKEGRDDPSQVSVTYSGQFYDVCRDLGAAALVISSSRVPGRVDDGNIAIRHRAIALEGGPGPLRYHLGQTWAALRLVGSALRFRADAVIVCNGSGHWFPLAVLRVFHVKVIPSLHCVLWPKHRQPGGLRKLIAKLDGWCFRRGCAALLSASQDIERQVLQLTGDSHPPIVEFLPTYRAEMFTGLGPPSEQRRPFRVLYAGRIERDKGVFQLLDIAKRFVAAGRTEIEFDICGSGSQLEELKKQTEAAGLAERFRCHGHCSRAVMREKFGQAHVLIVPTTTDFIEGFNQVVAEGVLSGRPVITSSVCPALEYVRDAVLEVPPDDVAAYYDAILRLCDDESLYRAKCAGCAAAQPQFYDTARGWAAALKRVLTAPAAGG